MSKRHNIPRDPVFSIFLKEKTAKFQKRHEGETYYCSIKCKKQFKKNRDKFVK